MRYVDLAFDEIANHPKISQGVAITTAGVSGAAEYVQTVSGGSVESWTKIGIIVGAIASIAVIYANLRRTHMEAQLTKADLRIKELQAERMIEEEKERDEVRKKRRERGEPLRRKSDKG